MAKFKITKGEWPPNIDWKREGWQTLEDPERTPIVSLGNFIKFMFSYEEDVHDDILRYFGSNFSLLYKLLKKVDWENCIVIASGTWKQELCSFFEFKSGSFEGHLREYVKLGIMIRVGVGEYMINPCFVFVGESEVQRKMIIRYERLNKEELLKQLDARKDEGNEE